MEALKVNSQLKDADNQQLVNIVREADRFASYIMFENASHQINAKSLLAVSILPHIEAEFSIKASGNDAKEAIYALKNLLESGHETSQIM